MCGIVGVVGPNLDVEAELKNVVAMRDRMVHRGPDGEGIWSSGRGAVLGHRRLAIVDLTANGRQPMRNEDGTVWITYNGEIYNHGDLRRGLEQRHAYRSRTDTETILHLYEDRGPACLDELLGMFALAIWDDRKQELFIARDRLGIKPLYYTTARGKFLFASEIKALLAHPDVEVDLDEQALYDYLTFLVAPAPNTLFRNIFKLPAGHCGVVDRSGRLTTWRWWDPLISERNDASDQDNVDTVRCLLRDSISKRMMSDVPFGVFLSGGVDSSANVALMSELMDRPVDTFTVGFARDAEFNELDHARRVARLFRTNHHEVLIDDDDLVDFLPELVHYQDEPLADPVCVPVHYVARLAKQSGTTVIQVGEGADEIFCGYTGYLRFLAVARREWRALRTMPRPVLRAAAPALVQVLTRTGRGQRADFVRRAAAGEELFWGGATVFQENEKAALAPGLGAARSSSRVVDQIYDVFDAGRPDADLLERMTYLELKQRLPELLLMRIDKMTMANSVEARVPFLDHRLVEFAMALSQAQKTRGGISKHVLKRAVEDVLPHDLLYRPKQGFGVPVSNWFRAELGDVLLRTIKATSLRDRGLIDFTVVEQLLNRHRAGVEDNGFRLWVMLNFVGWYDRWIAGTDGAW